MKINRIKFDKLVVDFKQQVENLIDEEIDNFHRKYGTVDDLELTVRSQRCLKQENIITICELINLCACNLLKSPNLGRKSLFEIAMVLNEKGFEMKYCGSSNCKTLQNTHVDSICQIKNSS